MSLSLREYQKDGVNFFLTSTGCLLADDMGLGKTVQVAAAINLLYLEKKIRRTLIVVPKAVAAQWAEELAIWADSVPARVVQGNSARRRAYFLSPYPLVVATYEQVRAESKLISECRDFSLVVLDEAQRIKNENSAIHKACSFIPRERTWILTGTPIENNVEEFSTIMSYVNPLIDLIDLSATEIHKKIQNHFLRRTKKEVLKELPEMITQTVKLNLSQEQLEEYRIESNLKERLNDESSMGDVLAAITRLKMICNKSSESGRSSKLDALKGILSDLYSSEHKVLVFSQFVETLDWLQRELDIPSWIYKGSLSDEERASTLSEFKKSEGPAILFISLRAGGVGLNLQEATHVVMFDRWWNPATEGQAIARAHRFGRKRVLHVFNFLVRNTIEDKIEKILERKIRLFEELVENADNVDLSSLNKSQLLCALYD